MPKSMTNSKLLSCSRAQPKQDPTYIMLVGAYACYFVADFNIGSGFVAPITRYSDSCFLCRGSDVCSHCINIGKILVSHSKQR
jgi:hypothetical protein